MALSPKTIRVSAALLLSAAFIFAGYYFSSPWRITIAGATTPDELLKDYAKKDTDADGLVDWQESLYGTDIENAHSIDPSLLDGEAVAQGKVALQFKSEAPSTPVPVTDADFEVPAPAKGSVTDEFAKSFFETYMTSGKGATGDNTALVADLVAEAKRRVAEKISSSYQSFSVRSVPGTSTGTYAAMLEATLLTHQVPDEARDATSVIDAYISKNDSSQKDNLLAIATAYRGMTADLATMSVPPSLAQTHLSFLRSTDLIAQSVAAIAEYQTDPLTTVGAIGIYQSSSIELGNALQSVGAAILQEGEPAPGAPGALILRILRGNGAL